MIGPPARTVRVAALVTAACALSAVVAATTATSTGTATPGSTSPVSATSPVSGAGTASGAGTVAVSRGDITEIVTLPATVRALPVFAVRALAAGRVSHGNPATGSAVTAGQHLFTVDGRQSDAPLAGAFVNWLVPDGTSVGAGVPVATLSYSGFSEDAVLPPDAAYRMLDGEISARAAITNGPGPFDCTLLPGYQPGQGTAVGAGSNAGGPSGGGQDGGQQAGAPDGPSAGGPAVSCAIPLDVKAVAGLAGTLAVRSAQAHGVLLLPVTAVAGTRQRGEVSAVGADGRPRVVDVGLGISDGAVVEITSGLSEGDRVLSGAPALEARFP